MILLCWFKRYGICLISFFNVYELFQAFIYANNIRSLVNSLFGVKIFKPFPSFNSSSSPSKDGISGKSSDSFLSVILLYFLTTHYNHILQEIILQDHIYHPTFFLKRLKIYCIYHDRFQETHHIILTLYQAHLFVSFMFVLFAILVYQIYLNP